MRVLNVVELEEVSGGIAPAVIFGVVVGVATIAGTAIALWDKVTAPSAPAGGNIYNNTNNFYPPCPPAPPPNGSQR